MHDVLTQTLVPVLAANPVLAVWDAVWPYLLMLAGFSAIVFVHELGHFAVAKWADVRVERFAVGFGRELFGFTKGETRYSFNLLPLGGYVKMLGQEDFDDKGNELKFNDDPRSFANKPVGHRAAIVSAGVIMNVLFACFLFMIVFLIGMEATAPRIAFVQQDSPADQAGLLSGDLVTEMNGQTIKEFQEILFAVLLSSPHEPIELRVERDGVERTFVVQPEYRDAAGTKDFRRQVIGISPGVTPKVVAVGPQIDESRPGAPHVGDVIVKVGEKEVTEENASQVYTMLAYTDQPVIVERPDPEHPEAPPERVEVRIPPMLQIYPSNPTDADIGGILGLSPLVRFYMVDPRGRAYLAGLDVGDTIMMFDDEPFPTRAMITRAIRHNAERDVAFRAMKPDGSFISGFVRPEINTGSRATIQAELEVIRDAPEDGPRVRIADVRTRGVAERAGIEPGDVILDVQGNANPSVRTVSKIIGGMRDTPVSIRVRKASGETKTYRVVPTAPGSIDAKYNLLAENIMWTSRVLERIGDNPTPAAEAGIPDGVKILAVNGKPVTRWRELIAAFEREAGGPVKLTYQAQGEGPVTVDFNVPHTIRTKLGIGPEGRIVSIGGSDTVTIESKAGKHRLSLGYHLGLKRRLENLVGETNVPVAYRENEMAPLKTAFVDVTEDMVDPWLGRVQFSPAVRWEEQTTLLKGENILDAVAIGLHKTYYFILQVLRTMERMIFTRTVGVESMSGPLGIIDMGGRLAQTGLVKFLFFMAIISANLAVINFLPLPIVDGGLMVFLLIEKIKGSPVSLRVQVATQMIGLFLIISAFVFVTYQDALRLFG